MLSKPDTLMIESHAQKQLQKSQLKSYFIRLFCKIVHQQVMLHKASEISQHLYTSRGFFYCNCAI